MGNRISRRTFLRLGAVTLAGALAATGALAWLTRNYRLSMLFEKLNAELEGFRYSYLPLGEAIRRHFHYLDLDPDGIEVFVRSYEGKFGRTTWRTNLKDVYLRYLMSTDFFQNGADEARTLRFAAFYWSPCYNPLARLS